MKKWTKKTIFLDHRPQLCWRKSSFPGKRLTGTRQPLLMSHRKNDPKLHWIWSKPKTTQWNWFTPQNYKKGDWRKPVIPVSPVPVCPRLPACLGNLQPVSPRTEVEILLSSSSAGGSTAPELQEWILNGWFHKQGFRGFKGEKGEPGLPGLDGLDAPCPVVWCSFFPFSMSVLSMVTTLTEDRNMHTEVLISYSNLLTTFFVIY